RPTSFSHLMRMLTSSYRPIRNLSYALDFGIWGASPFGFHLTNIIIHAANTVLVFWLVRRISSNRGYLPFVAAAIFAVHPIQTNAVTYISGRRDILFSLFYIASFHAYLSFRKSRSPKHAGLFVGLWILSLMTKEMAVSLPAVIFLWNFCDAWSDQTGSTLRRSVEAGKRAFAADKLLYIGLIAAAAGYAWYQTYLVGASLRSGYAGLRYWGGGFMATALTMMRVHAWYLKQLVLPTPIAQYYGAFDISTTLLDWRVLASLVLIVAVLAAAFALLGKNKAMAFAIFSYFAILLPVSQIIPHHELLADHYLYLPMMSFGLGVALIARKISSRSLIATRAVVATITVALMVLGVMTVFRNTVYKDDLTLWKTNCEEAPNSLRAISSLASQYATSYPARSAELYKRCIALNPSYAGAY